MESKKITGIFISVFIIISLFQNVSAVNFDQIDQSQTQENIGYWVGVNQGTLKRVGQSIVANYDILSKVKLLLSGAEPDPMPTTDIILEIRWDINNPSSTQRTVAIDPSIIPYEWNEMEWIEFDFNDLELPSSKEFYIVLWADLNQNNDCSILSHGYSNPGGEDVYPQGNTYLSVGQNENWEIEDTDLSFKTYGYNNNAPNQPSSPSPSNNANNVNIYTDLNWDGGDPDGNSVVYDIYFEKDDTNPNVKVEDDYDQTTYNPGTLDYDSDYYWQIISKDQFGEETSGPVWHFHTGSYSPGVSTLTFYIDPNNKGSITFEGNSYQNGDSTELNNGQYSATGNGVSGYQFSHWSTTGGITVSDSQSKTTTVNVNGDGSLRAYFSQETLQINFYTYPSDTGHIVFNDVTYHHGGKAYEYLGEYTAVAGNPEGFYFGHWTSTDGVSVSSPYSSTSQVTVSGDGSLTVVYVAEDPTITFNTEPSDKGAINFWFDDNNHETYYNGESVQVTSNWYMIESEIPSGYVFSRWSKTGEITICDEEEDATMILISGDGSIKANFKKLYKIDFCVSPPEGGHINFEGFPFYNGDSFYLVDGEEYEIDAIANQDFDFNHWTTSGGVNVEDKNSESTILELSEAGMLKVNFDSELYVPLLSYHPASLDFGKHYQGFTDSKSFKIWNSGQSVLEYEIIEDLDWITVSPTSGESSGEEDEITVTVLNTNNMNGNYSGNITINSNAGSKNILIDLSIKPPAEWTLIFYIALDDTVLSPQGELFIYYLKQIGSIYGKMEIITLYDKFLNDNTKAAHILKDSTENIPLNEINSEWGSEINTGDPQSLIDFSLYCMNNYPAKHYLIATEGHGAHWKGCCPDLYTTELTTDFLELDELKEAFQTLKPKFDDKLDTLFFRNCVMNCIESVYQLTPFVYYQVGSETVTYGASFNKAHKTFLENLKNNLNGNGYYLSNLICNNIKLIDDKDTRSECASNIIPYKGYTVSYYLDSLADTMIENLDDNKYFQEIKNARENCVYIFGPFDGDIQKLIDIKDFAERILEYSTDTETKSKAQEIINSFKEAVINCRHSDSAKDFDGMSIYFPDEIDRYDDEYETSCDFTRNTKWDEFLGKYLDRASEKGVRGWDAHITARVGYEKSTVIFGEDIDATDCYDPLFDELYDFETHTKFDFWSVNFHDYWEKTVDIRDHPDIDEEFIFEFFWCQPDAVLNLTWDVSSIPYESYTAVKLIIPGTSTEINMRKVKSISLDIGPLPPNDYICIKVILYNPPLQPSINGPANGEAGEEYFYTFLSSDPQDQYIKYHIDWGDGCNQCIGPFKSGVPLSIGHTWSEEGSYTITAKAEDSDNLLSIPGFLQTTMPYNYQNNQQGSQQQSSSSQEYQTFIR